MYHHSDNEMKPVEKFTWYLLEDDPDDVQLLNEAIELSGLPIELQHFYSSENLMDELQKPYAPNVVILDINLPYVSGIDILSTLKKDERLKDLTVVMFTSSDMKKYYDQSRSLGAASYLTKPFQFDKYQEVIREIFELGNMEAA